MQWKVLLQKELLENWRNYKWLWVPIVIIIITIMNPVMNYFLPEIIESFGNLPEGAIIELPQPSITEAVMMSFEQLNSLGVLIFILISMGTIAKEKEQGIVELILTKPVAIKNYVIAKWLAWNLLVWGSLMIGFLINWYYIEVLYGSLSFMTVLQMIFFYGLWLSFIITLVIFYNTCFTNQGAIAFITILTILLMFGIGTIFSKSLIWSPHNIIDYIHTLLIQKKIPTDLIKTSVITIITTSLLLIAAIFNLKRQYQFKQ